MNTYNFFLLCITFLCKVEKNYVWTNMKEYREQSRQCIKLIKYCINLIKIDILGCRLHRPLRNACDDNVKHLLLGLGTFAEIYLRRAVNADSVSNHRRRNTISQRARGSDLYTHWLSSFHLFLLCCPPFS